MSLKFEEGLNIVAKEILEAPKPKYQTYSQDAAEISAKMDQELISINSIFKGTVSNWEETAALCKAEVSKFQMPFLRLKTPFAVEPQRIREIIREDGEAVNLKTSVNHPAVENGYLNGEKLIQLFISDLNKVLDRIPNITCSSGKIYTLRIDVSKNPRGGIHIHIEAMENDSEDVPSILYNFVPSFIFTNQSFFYIYISNYFFQTEDRLAIRKTKKMTYNVEIMLQTLANQYSKKLPVDLILVHLMQLESETGIGPLLLEAVKHSISLLQNPGLLINAYGKLLRFKQSDSVKLSELKEVFGLK